MKYMKLFTILLLFIVLIQKIAKASSKNGAQQHTELNTAQFYELAGDMEFDGELFNTYLKDHLNLNGAQYQYMITYFGQQIVGEPHESLVQRYESFYQSWTQEQISFINYVEGKHGRYYFNVTTGAEDIYIMDFNNGLQVVLSTIGCNIPVAKRSSNTPCLSFDQPMEEILKLAYDHAIIKDISSLYQTQSMGEFSTNIFKMYPNPLQGEVITIQFTEIPKEEFDVVLIAPTGESVLQQKIKPDLTQNQYQVPLTQIQELKAGNYILKVKNSSAKLIIN